jgi:hypothetical protein
MQPFPLGRGIDQLESFVPPSFLGLVLRCPRDTTSASSSVHQFVHWDLCIPSSYASEGNSLRTLK